MNEHLREKATSTNNDENEMAVSNDTSMSVSKGTGSGIAYMATEPHDSNGDPIIVDDVFHSSLFCGYSEIREQMMRRVKNKGLTQPASNRIKKKE